MLPSKYELKYYLEAGGASPFAKWFDQLPREAGAKVAVALTRMGQGNLSNTKGVGEGVFEYRIDFGPGFRVYFGKDGDKLIILLCGGTKKKQQRDIEAAKIQWKDYKRRKSGKGD
jgi:putative addiction module killer protein